MCLKPIWLLDSMESMTLFDVDSYLPICNYIKDGIRKFGAKRWYRESKYFDRILINLFAKQTKSSPFSIASN